MRVALVAESFLPHMNGVTGSVLHVLRHLAAQGHEALVIAPRAGEIDTDLHGARTALVPSVPLPSYPAVRVALQRARPLTAVIREFDPDVIHLASPFVLGWQALAAADALHVPAVAVYQTDVIAYVQRYGMPRSTALVAQHVARLHRRATLTLAPSAAASAQLEALGVDRIRRWVRGVDADRFAPERRSDAWRARFAPGETIVGYVGRLAPEKQVEDLVALNALPGVRLVIVGDGPSRPMLERMLPAARFLGHLSGAALAEAVASFDVFVHPGESETFGQTIQEALASGVPVVATGRGGPLDLVRSSVDGWLYRPGDLGDLRDRVADLVGDDAKRRAFSRAARLAMRERTWDAVCADLVGHYRDATELRPIDDALLARAGTRPGAPSAGPAGPRWTRYVALGDSISEGLCDRSRMPAGQYRGWADRLALLLAQTAGRAGTFRYANLAVRSRRIADVLDEQLPRALELKPELVSVLIGANDLARVGADPVRLAAQLGDGVARLRDAGCDVLLVTPFLPRRRLARLLAPHFAAFNSELRRIARETGSLLLDLEAHPALGDLEMWADDKVHLRSRGHRFVAYRAAETLGVPHAETLAELDAAFHADDEAVIPGTWLSRDLLPWLWRRARGRTAGDGLVAKHSGYVAVPGAPSTASASPVRGTSPVRRLRAP